MRSISNENCVPKHVLTMRFDGTCTVVRQPFTLIFIPTLSCVVYDLGVSVKFIDRVKILMGAQ